MYQRLEINPFQGFRISELFLMVLKVPQKDFQVNLKHIEYTILKSVTYGFAIYTVFIKKENWNLTFLSVHVSICHHLRSQLLQLTLVHMAFLYNIY